jgi:hypothetical protein
MAADSESDERIRRVLLVEGPEDGNVCFHLAGRHGIADQFTILACEGIKAAFESLETRLLAGNEDALGIVIDVDGPNLPDAVHRRWTRFQAIARARGFATVPERPHPGGTVVREAGHPVLDVWLMPDNELPGMLEDFVGRLIPDAEPSRKLWARALAVVQTIPEDERLFGPTDVSKAMIHTWLAWQAEPGNPMGFAIRKGFLNPHAPHALKLVAWLRDLFDLAAA